MYISYYGYTIRHPSPSPADPVVMPQGAGKEGRLFVGTEAPVAGDSLNLAMYPTQEITSFDGLIDQYFWGSWGSCMIVFFHFTTVNIDTWK